MSTQSDVLEIKFQGKTLRFNGKRYTNVQSRIVENHCGRVPMEFFEMFARVKEMKTADFEAMYWLMRTQSGEWVSIEQVANEEWDILEFMAAFAEGAKHQAEVLQRERAEEDKRDLEAGLAIPKAPAAAPTPEAELAQKS